MTFANPQMFWLLLLLPLMVYVHFWRENQRASDFRYPTTSGRRTGTLVASPSAAYSVLSANRGGDAADHCLGQAAIV
jgi:hypothetical protein